MTKGLCEICNERVGVTTKDGMYVCSSCARKLRVHPNTEFDWNTLGKGVFF